MSELSLDDNGLPEPGRELDGWIWATVFHKEPIPWEPHVDIPCPYCGQEMYRTDRRAWCSTCREWRYSPYQEYSTSAALFQVMEAVRGKWAFEFEQMRGHDADLCVVLKDTNEPSGTVPLVDTWVTTRGKTLEEAYAHAACASLWKALSDE